MSTSTPALKICRKVENVFELYNVIHTCLGCVTKLYEPGISYEFKHNYLKMFYDPSHFMVTGGVNWFLANQLRAIKQKWFQHFFYHSSPSEQSIFTKTIYKSVEMKDERTDRLFNFSITLVPFLVPGRRIESNQTLNRTEPWIEANPEPKQTLNRILLFVRKKQNPKPEPFLQRFGSLLGTLLNNQFYVLPTHVWWPVFKKPVMNTGMKEA